jgi:hypothetical protein
MADKRRHSNDAEVGSAEDIRRLLTEIRENLSQTKKASVGEYIRLLELLRETEAQTEAEVKVGWCDWSKDE